MPFFNFFFFFSYKFTHSFFFFKCVSFKKKYVYSFDSQPIHFFKAARKVTVFNSLSSNEEKFNIAFKTSFSKKPRAFSVKKTFLMYKKKNIEKFISFFKFKYLKRRNLFNFFLNFRNFSTLNLITFFSLNFFKVLHRIFPFFNFFFLKLMVARGLVLVNFKKIVSQFLSLKVGDFISVFLIKNLWVLITHMQVQQLKHLGKVKTKLIHLAKGGSVNNAKIKSRYFSKYFLSLTSFFRKQPVWVEVDYLSFSFFIIKKSQYLDFAFYFNPFLYRLLEYK